MTTVLNPFDRRDRPIGEGFHIDRPADGAELRRFLADFYQHFGQVPGVDIRTTQRGQHDSVRSEIVCKKDTMRPENLRWLAKTGLTYGELLNKLAEEVPSLTESKPVVCTQIDADPSRKKEYYLGFELSDDASDDKADELYEVWEALQQIAKHRLTRRIYPPVIRVAYAGPRVSETIAKSMVEDMWKSLDLSMVLDSPIKQPGADERT